MYYHLVDKVNNPMKEKPEGYIGRAATGCTCLRLELAAHSWPRKFTSLLNEHFHL